MLTHFTPGHDARILTTGASNDTTINIALEFNMEMSCDGVTAALSLNASSSGSDLFPRVRDGSVGCTAVDGYNTTYLSGDVSSMWQWSAVLDDVPDGIIELTLTHPPNNDSSDNTHATDHLFFRKGTSKNVMVFPDADYDTDGSFTFESGHYVFRHQAKGADLFRYSWNFGKNHSQWMPYEDTTSIPSGVFDDCKECFWDGQHIIVECNHETALWDSFSDIL